MKTTETLKDTVRYAYKFKGIPYIWGGNSFLTGLDCSAYALHIAFFAGLAPALDKTAQGLYSHLSAMDLRSGATQGAFIFYGQSKWNITHVDFMISCSEVIGAIGGNSSTKTISDAAERQAMVKIRTLGYRSDIVAAVKPNWIL